MNLSVTIAPESIASIKSAIMAEIRQPELTPSGLAEVASVAKEIIDNHGDSLVNSIVDTRIDDISQRIAEQTSKEDIAAHIDLSDLSAEFSVRDIASNIDIDASDVADRIDLSDLAQHLDIDTDEIAERVANDMDMSEVARQVADEVCYETLADALNNKALAKEIVGQFVSNEEFRRAFMDTLLTTLSASIK